MEESIFFIVMEGEIKGNGVGSILWCFCQRCSGTLLLINGKQTDPSPGKVACNVSRCSKGVFFSNHILISMNIIGMCKMSFFSESTWQWVNQSRSQLVRFKEVLLIRVHQTPINCVSQRVQCTHSTHPCMYKKNNKTWMEHIYIKVLGSQTTWHFTT